MTDAIAAVEALRFRLPPAGAAAEAGAPRTGAAAGAPEPGGHRACALVVLRTRSGVTGLGDASPPPIPGARALDVTCQAIEYVAEAWAGRDPADAVALLGELDRVTSELRWARFGLETALLDAAARLAGRRVCDLLGGARRERIELQASLPDAGAAETGRAAAAARAAGFGCLLLDVGLDPDADDARLAAARAALGTRGSLRLHARERWDQAGAIAALARLSRHGIEHAVEPVAALDLAALARVRAAAPVPIAVAEAVTAPGAAARIADARAADALIVDPARAGGLRDTCAIAALARARGLRALVRSDGPSGVAVAAAAHAAATLDDPLAACPIAAGAAAALVRDPPEVRDGALYVPRGPGLGVSLDTDALARTALAQRRT